MVETAVIGGFGAGNDCFIGEGFVVYTSNLVQRIESKLLIDITTGEVRRIRLERGLGLAYAGSGESGLLTLSRKLPEKASSDDEVRIVKRDFTAAGRLDRPVLRYKELARETVQHGCDRHHVIRFRVFFGKQGRLF